MAKDTTITARIPGDVGEQLARFSDAMGRSKSWVVNEALRSYLAAEMEFIAAVEEGLGDAEAGRVVDHAEVVKDFERRKRRRARRA
jgi:predicted transcriptional regulator